MWVYKNGKAYWDETRDIVQEDVERRPTPSKLKKEKTKGCPVGLIILAALWLCFMGSGVLTVCAPGYQPDYQIEWEGR